MLLFLTGNSLLAHYWGRIHLPTRLASGLAMWLSLARELGIDVQLPRKSFRKQVVRHHLSLCHEISAFQIGAAPSAEQNIRAQLQCWPIKGYTTGPGWVLSCAQRGGWFDSWSGHKSRFWARFLVGVPAGGSRLMFPSLCPSPFLSFSKLIKKYFKKRICYWDFVIICCCSIT